MVQWIKNEFWNGYSLYERVFMISLILLQVVMYVIAPDTIIGMICGIAGVICVRTVFIAQVLKITICIY